MIKDMSEEKAIILSTHILDEVDAVCSRAIIIAGGRIVADETPADLRKKSAMHGAVTLSLKTGDTQTLLSCLGNVPDVKSVELLSNEENNIKVRVFPEDKNSLLADKLLVTLMENKYQVQSAWVEQGRLDDVFRMITA
jgi:ABC-2 type transport system ATP-binding protein